MSGRGLAMADQLRSHRSGLLALPAGAARRLTIEAVVNL
jgi:hypothetical protein